MELSIYENISSPSKTQIHGMPSNLYNSRYGLTQVIWSWEEDKIFENSLAEFGIDSKLLLPSLAMRLQSKSVLEIKKHFKVLVEDIRMIESGLVKIPNYEARDDKLKASKAMVEGSPRETKPSQSKNEAYERPENGSTSRNSKKGIPWTKNEHSLFIEGLRQYGKGDWKSISRYCVKTKTSAQVASHAQKYFLKLKNPNRGEKRMTTAGDSFVGEVPNLRYK